MAGWRGARGKAKHWEETVEMAMKSPEKQAEGWMKGRWPLTLLLGQGGPHCRKQRRGKDPSGSLSPRRARAAFKAANPQPPTSPLSHRISVPRGEADELTAQGADGDAECHQRRLGTGEEEPRRAGIRPRPGEEGEMAGSHAGWPGWPQEGQRQRGRAPTHQGAACSTGRRRWRRSKSAGAAPQGAGPPRPSC